MRTISYTQLSMTSRVLGTGRYCLCSDSIVRQSIKQSNDKLNT